MNESNPPGQRRKIVSSRHLANDKWELSELEYGMIIANNAFNKWMVRCMAAAGQQEFNPLDVLVLHNVNHRDRSKRLIDICFLLNIEDTHTVNYAVKKLVKLNLIVGEKQGKEMFYSTTDPGKKLCDDYRQVRKECLIEVLQMWDIGEGELSEKASFLRALSGLYDQASRAAASL
ncbi:MAG: winged helix DNA-binding protein [Methyloligellaceae bacterium]